MVDVGLMGAMADAPAEAMITNNDIFTEYKGAFTELFVNNELTSHGIETFYHSVDDSTIEIDFVIQSGTKVVPIECKAEENVKAKYVYMTQKEMNRQRFISLLESTNRKGIKDVINYIHF